MKTTIEDLRQSIAELNAISESSMVALKKQFPQIRRSHPVAIVHSGGKQCIFGCICGARHSAATSYRDARHVERFRAEHEDCAERLIAAGESPVIGMI